jgi:CheY-like chemotaxis protein
MDGYEVARRLREQNGHNPVRLVALTRTDKYKIESAQDPLGLMITSSNR